MRGERTAQWSSTEEQQIRATWRSSGEERDAGTTQREREARQQLSHEAQQQLDEEEHMGTKQEARQQTRGQRNSQGETQQWEDEGRRVEARHRSEEGRRDVRCCKKLRISETTESHD